MLQLLNHRTYWKGVFRKFIFFLFPFLEREYEEMLRRLELLEQIATTDPLTGLLNERGLEDAFKRVVTAVDHSVSPESAMLIDSDGNPVKVTGIFFDLNEFKAVNDIHGHDAGNFVLTVIAEKLRTCYPRLSDVCARIGGDEFFVVMLGASVKDAQAKVGLFRQMLWDEPHLQFGDIHITASIGVAPIEIATTQNLIRDLTTGRKQADVEMYKDKEAYKKAKEEARKEREALKLAEESTHLIDESTE